MEPTSELVSMLNLELCFFPFKRSKKGSLTACPGLTLPPREGHGREMTPQEFIIEELHGPSLNGHLGLEPWLQLR